LVRNHSLWSNASPDVASWQRGKWWRHDIELAFTDHDGGNDWSYGREPNTLAPLYQFMRTQRDAGQRFMALAAIPIPHAPYTPPEEFRVLYDGLSTEVVANLPWGGLRGRKADAQKYFGMVSWFDWHVGQVFSFLDAEGLRDDTVVFICTDNGNLLLKSKTYNRDDGCRTPMIVNCPRAIPGGVRSRALISHVDLYPTILDYMGIAQPPHAPTFDLHSLRTLCEGGGVGQCRAFVCNLWDGSLAIEQEIDGVLYRAYGPPGHTAATLVWNLDVDPCEHFPSILATAEGQMASTLLWPKARAWLDDRVAPPLIPVAPAV
jgi:hypothetical protein